MPIRVIVNGATGKMGQITCRTLYEHPEFDLVAELGRGDHLANKIRETDAQIVIDLTRADCVYDNARTIIERGVHAVIGTSGLMPEQIKALTELSDRKNLGGIIVPNFSISAVLMMHMAQIASRFLPEVEIIEAHHQQKLDAPSGTALKTAEMIANARTQAKQQLTVKESVPHARGAVFEEINIHAIRLPGFLAQQQIIFGQMGETLNLTHTSIDRTSFMPGVILACQHVFKLNTLYYGLEHLLNLKE